MKEETEGEISFGTTHRLAKNVKTNISKHFLHLLDKHFDRNHKYHKTSIVIMSKLVLFAWVTSL